ELERLIERAVALAETDVIELDDLPPAVRAGYAAALLPSVERNETLRAWGSRYARLILERSRGNKREACRILDISYHTLRKYPLYFAGNPAQAGRVKRWSLWVSLSGISQARRRQVRTTLVCPQPDIDSEQVRHRVTGPRLGE